jgi:hypothetical protein
MFTVAQEAGISPLRLGFTGTLKVLQRAISDFQNVSPDQRAATFLRQANSRDFG